jgi:alpha-glucosidase (family GH31 glycosyl hydrolase)
MNAFIKLNGKNYIGKVWPGLTSFVDFLHPNGSKYWNMMFDELYEKIPFSGVWIDMNEIADFNGNAPTYEFETYKVQHN